MTFKTIVINLTQINGPYPSFIKRGSLPLSNAHKMNHP